MQMFKMKNPPTPHRGIHTHQGRDGDDWAMQLNSEGEYESEEAQRVPGMKPLFTHKDRILQLTAPITSSYLFYQRS